MLQMIRTMPRCSFLRHLFFLLLLLSPLTSLRGGAAAESKNPISLFGFRNEQKHLPVDRPASRSLLYSRELTEPNTELVVDRSGKVSLIMQSTEKPIWSFSSGSPIHSSYQAPPSAVNKTENATETSSAFIVEYMDKSEATSTTTADNRYTRWNMEDLLKKMPLVTDDGLVLGSKTATAYLVDGMSGRLIHVYKSSTHSSGDNNKNANAMVKPTSTDNFVKLPLLITRTDSKLEHFDKTTRKLVWNVTVSSFRADLLCDIAFNSGNELGPEIATGIYMPLQCGSQTEVHSRVKSELFIRVPRDQEMKLDSADEAKMLPGGGDNRLSLPSSKTRESRKLQEQDGRNQENFFRWSPLKLFVPLFLLGAVVAVFVKRSSSRGGDENSKTEPSKKKRNRKSGKDGITNEQMLLLGLPNGGATDGRKIGKLFVSNTEIAKGSNGTVVFEGFYEGRPVAVKRLVRSHHEVAFKEIQNLIASDQHANIIRWYGVEYDRDFVYLSLERCICTLDGLLKTYLVHETQLVSLEGIINAKDLCKVGGYPSPIMLKLMRDIVSGLAHLHQLGIVHRDLKPQNVLIQNVLTLSAKLSDMGISKRLSGDMSSLGHLATGCGSSGWQAPEQLLQGRQTRAVDMFSLGCVLFYSITGCNHPFGDDLERDVNIVNNKVDLSLVEHLPEVSDLISNLLNQTPDLRPSAHEVLLHPMFWNAETRLSFLRDASDRVELENREADSEILKAMESTAPVAIGGKWGEKLESDFITNIGRYRRYKYDSIRDLLRVIRNKLNHYRELPPEIQELVGTVPEGFDEYFAVRFPKLLIEVYRVISLHCKEEEVFRKYFKSSII
uniref:non-specific serine/threonine protein kinase n=1 Tax=Noccaea caerulescens TaxID=107243 RepID=A0A1J3D3U9_NOCCA